MSHISVLLHETVDALLADRNTGIYVDGTFGRGGHTRLLLSKLDENARVYGFDKDPQALETAAILEQEDPRFKIIHASFADLKQELEARGIGLVDGVMADLGVSSPQLDQAERGFSFMKDGPLDMRMDNSKGPTAAEWLVNIEEEALANIIFQYGEERYSRRIAINKELEDIEAFLPQAVDVLKTEGRLAVISFHSLEDRLIKQFIQKESTLAEDTSWGMPQEREDTRRLKKISRVRASEAEIKANFRSRSAWLRVAERLALKGE